MSEPNDDRGFGTLPCILCGADAVIRLNMDDCVTLDCAECEEQFSVSQVESVIAQWQPVIAWIRTAPKRGAAS